MHFPLHSLLFVAPVISTFVHPGLLVTNTDITRIKAKIAAKEEPWLSSWNKLTSLTYSQSTYTPNAAAVLDRSTNTTLLWHDAAAVFNLALRWKITGNTSYAATASNILTAWGITLTSLGTTDDQYLTAGLQGHELVNAAELLLDYTPFTSKGLSTFTSMFTRVFLPLNLNFLNHIASSEHNVLHFFANWELCNMASVMAFGVLTNNQTLFDFAVNYYKNGTGNGAIGNAVTNLVAEPGTGTVMGQGQESGRDQGHSALDWQLEGVVGQQAWNQGVDLFGWDDNRLLKGAEYFARYNLGNDVPFVPYTNGIVSYTEISNSSRGSYRPTWELLYSHYAQIKGLDAPWTEEYRNFTVTSMGGFEGGAGSWGEGSGHYDGLGWGSLLYRLDSSDVSVAKTSEAAVEPSTSASLAAVSTSSVASIVTSTTPTSTTASKQTTTVSGIMAVTSAAEVDVGEDESCEW